nr:unnamed protein product [Spirometra erinaceieuropaei]
MRIRTTPAPTATAPSPHTSACSVTCESIALRLANQCLEHQPTPTALAIHCPHCPRTFTHRMGLFGDMRIHESAIDHNSDTPTTFTTPTRPITTFAPSPHAPITNTITNSTTTTTTTTKTAASFTADTHNADLSCPHCPRTFTSRIGLLGHLRIHRTAAGEPVPEAPTYTEPGVGGPPRCGFGRASLQISVVLVEILVICCVDQRVWWNAKVRIRPSHPPAPSLVFGLPDSVLTPGPGGGGGESGHLDAPSIAKLAPSGLRPCPEARPAGHTGDKWDPGCQRLDRPSPRHLQDVESPTASWEASSNELAQTLANPPVADAAVSANENASVAKRWCQRRDKVQATVLIVLDRASRQSQDWFDDIDDISKLVAEKESLHKAFVDRDTPTKTKQPSTAVAAIHDSGCGRCRSPG